MKPGAEVYSRWWIHHSQNCGVSKAPRRTWTQIPAIQPFSFGDSRPWRIRWQLQTAAPGLCDYLQLIAASTFKHTHSLTIKHCRPGNIHRVPPWHNEMLSFVVAECGWVWQNRGQAQWLVESSWKTKAKWGLCPNVKHCTKISFSSTRSMFLPYVQSNR